MDEQTRRRAPSCAHGPLPGSRSGGAVSMTANTAAFPLTQLPAGARVVKRDADGRAHADPGRIVAGLMLSGFLTEACLMGRIEGGPYEVGGAVAGFALLFLAWFWLSLGCLLQGGLRLVAIAVRGRTLAVSLVAAAMLAC